MTFEKEVEKESFKKRYNNMSTKEKVKELGKVFIFAICIIGLTYQTYQLTAQYFSGQTIVNIKVVKFRTTRLPAITVCYPIFASMEKLAKLYPQMKDEFEKYKYLINNINETDRQNDTFIDMLSKITETTENYTRKAYSTINSYELFNKTSIPFEFWNRSLSEEELSEMTFNKTIDIPIRARVRGFTRRRKRFIDLQDSSPIESIVSEYEEFWPRKCYTFFSQFSKRWDDLKLKVEFFNFTITHDPYWYPIYHYNNDFAYYFSMHSPNTFPQMRYEDNYIELKAGHKYQISFYRIRTKRLPPSYVTNCRDYNTSNVNEEHSRTDCIDRCILKALKEKCGNCLHHIGSLFRKEWIRKPYSEMLCDYEGWDKSGCKKKDIYELRENCKEQCPSHCLRQYVEFNVKKEAKIHSKDPWNPKTTIYVTHSRLPDQRIDHLPEMTFVAFAANFGGLAGMWLGMSVFAAYNLFEKIIR